MRHGPSHTIPSRVVIKSNPGGVARSSLTPVESDPECDPDRKRDRATKAIQVLRQPNPGTPCPMFPRAGGRRTSHDTWVEPRRRNQNEGGQMATIEESIDVNVPVPVAYNQWTQFEEFPTFMDGVESVRQVDATHLHWTPEIGGRRHEWDAEITEQVPDQRVAWTSTSGKRQGRLSDDETRVLVSMDYEPEGVVESVGSALDLDSRRIRADPKRFKEMIEARGNESGAWRGTVEQDDVR